MATSRGRINVAKTHLPPLGDYTKYLEKIWKSNQLSNNGSLSKEFEEKVSEYLNIDSNRFKFVTNGTLALQLALNALDITEGEVITTPFSYVATTSAILWERCKPVYVDIDPFSFNIDVSKIEAAITPETKAILAVHVFGNPCKIDEIEGIAKKHKLKVIYDGAHAFGVTHKGKSVFENGDISTMSFHATKSFQTIEGGGIYVRDKRLAKTVELSKRFGHNADEHVQLGINAKANEFQAAMGLATLKYSASDLKTRKNLFSLYDKLLQGFGQTQTLAEGTEYNFAYYPLVLKDEKTLLKKLKQLAKLDIYPRRYFYPSLNTLPYLSSQQSCPISEDIASRIMCLPLYNGLSTGSVMEICEAIRK